MAYSVKFARRAPHHRRGRMVPAAAVGFAQWDHEVDVLCIGAEGGALAAAIVARSAGLEPFVGVCNGASATAGLAAGLGAAGGDEPTSAFLDGFDYAFDQDSDRTFGDHHCPASNEIPVRTVADISGARGGPQDSGVVAPFFGALLEPWARRCAAATHGVLYNQVAKRQMTAVRSGAGETIEAAVVGSVSLRPSDSFSVTSWLRTQATQADVQSQSDVRLARLIFEDASIVGAQLLTAAGPLTVRAHQNVVIGLGNPLAGQVRPVAAGTDAVDIHVCLVSKAASRFGQLELVVGDDCAERVAFLPDPQCEPHADPQPAIGR